MILRPLVATFVAILLAGWALLAGAQDMPAVPALKARVTDLTATLSAEQQQKLEARLQAFQEEKGAQIAVLLVPTTKPEPIEQYALRVAEQWKLGRKGVDDGALLVVAKQDRKLRIEVGYGLEGALNDATAKRIIAETITPHFKEGRFYEGIDAGLTRILGVVRGEPLPETWHSSEREASGPASPSETSLFDAVSGLGLGLIEFLIIGLVVLTFAAKILRAVFGRLAGSAIAGFIGWTLAMFFVSTMLIAVIVGIAVFVFSLISGGGRSSGIGNGGAWSSGYSGGGSSDSSWSSSSSDSFSGGGGDFGGGGASGDW